MLITSLGGGNLKNFKKWKYGARAGLLKRGGGGGGGGGGALPI